MSSGMNIFQLIIRIIIIIIMNTCKAPVSAKHDARGALDNYTFKQKNDCEKDEF